MRRPYAGSPHLPEFRTMLCRPVEIQELDRHIDDSASAGATADALLDPLTRSR